MNDSLKINSQCISCILNKNINKLPKNIGEEEKLKYIKGVLKIIAECDNSLTAPEIIALITEYKNKMFGFSDDFADIKKYYNNLMLKKESFFEEQINISKNPLKTALKFALLGNYIDFGALDAVDDLKLSAIPTDAETLQLNDTVFKHFLKELSTSKNLVYLTDNCGEIVIDKLFIKQLKNCYPSLNITVIVKGAPVLNDATMEDAKAVSIDKFANVIHNGSNVAGTALNRISSVARDNLDNADIIISKGQANFETLNGCGKNIYYLFLCKCSLYSERFNVPQFTGLFIK